MKTKQQLLDEFASEGDDGPFLEVLADLRDVLQALLDEVQKLANPIITLEKDGGVDAA